MRLAVVLLDMMEMVINTTAVHCQARISFIFWGWREAGGKLVDGGMLYGDWMEAEGKLEGLVEAG